MPKDEIPGLAENIGSDNKDAPPLPGSPESNPPAVHAPPPAGADHPDKTPPLGSNTGTPPPEWWADPIKRQQRLSQEAALRIQIREAADKVAEVARQAAALLGP